MNPQTIFPVNAPLLDGNERKYVLECLDSGWISSEGPFVAAFETRLAQRTGRKYGIAVANGSVALDAAIAALRLSPGDEVIMPAFTIISCAAAIVRAQAVPVLVDSAPDTWNMDVSQIESRITSRTRAIMVVHIYGLPVDMPKVLAIASRYGLKVIEDAAEAHGLRCAERECGSFGDVSTFSFYPNKHVTTGEGGMILTDDAELAERCRSLRNLCFNPARRFVHDELGWNFRMTNLQAALGLAQLESLDRHIKLKREMGAAYRAAMGDSSDIQIAVERTSYAENIYWVFGVVIGSSYSFDAAEAMKRLAAVGVGTRPFFWPMHEQPVLRKMGLFATDSHPVAERIARRGFYLPSGLALRADEIPVIVDRLRTVLS